jgi:Uma2 family endonuclease
MSVMTAPEFWVTQDRMLTVEDMEHMSDDEFTYELDDGVLVVSPAPSSLHQLVIARLQRVLEEACPATLVVLPGVGINISRIQHRVPDIAVLRWTSFREPFPEEAPVLAVEVASPRTRAYDRRRKKDVYQDFGIGSYWIVDPGGDEPGLTAFELRRGRYVEAGQVSGTQPFETERPFPVTVVPAALVARPAG